MATPENLKRVTAVASALTLIMACSTEEPAGECPDGFGRVRSGDCVRVSTGNGDNGGNGGNTDDAGNSGANDSGTSPDAAMAAGDASTPVDSGTNGGGSDAGAVCDPNTVTCTGGAAGHPFACSADGTTLTQSDTCVDGEYCSGAACVDDVCPQGTLYCEGGQSGDSHQCSELGDSSTLVTDCRGDQTCVNGMCVDGICPPGQTYCNGGPGGHPFTCSAAGDSETQSATCNADQFCMDGACVADVCEQGQTVCRQGHPYLCNENGDGGSQSATCNGTQRCEGGVCVPNVNGPCPLGDPFDLMILQQHVSFLASDALGGREPGSVGDTMARDFIEQRFRCLSRFTGAGPNGAYQQPFVNIPGTPTANVFAVIPGSDPVVGSEVIVIGGHHDHLGFLNGAIRNGANDNASGTVAVMAVAQAIQQSGFVPRRTLVFIAFGSEEGILEGSYFYAANPAAGYTTANTVYMMNLDIVGGNSAGDAVSAFGSFAGTPARAILDALAPTNTLNLDYGIAAGAVSSDFEPFCAENIPYVFFETWDPACYHQACDDAERLDYDMLSRISRLSFEVVMELANTTTDLAAARATIGCGR